MSKSLTLSRALLSRLGLGSAPTAAEVVEAVANQARPAPETAAEDDAWFAGHPVDQYAAASDAAREARERSTDTADGWFPGYPIQQASGDA